MQEYQFQAPRPATLEDCKEASTSEAHRRYHVADVQFEEVTVNGKRRKVEPGEKLASNSKVQLKYSPSVQPQSDPFKKAVMRLAKRELLSFAAALRSRICSGKPNQPSADALGFAKKVDAHSKVFQPYLKLTGVTAQELKRDATASFNLRNADAHPTDVQLQQMADDCQDYVELMQGTMQHECQLVLHFECIRSNLFRLS